MADVDSTPEPAEFIQLLDEHHLVMFTDEVPVSDRTQQMLCDSLRTIPEAEVIELDGQRIATTADLCRELGPSAGEADESHCTIQALIDFVRSLPGQPHHRFILWRNADVMLDADVLEFGRVINALCLVAAEFEHLDLTSLVLHRFVLSGGSKLGAYAEDVNGQLNAWLHDDEATAELLARIEPIVPRPPFLIYRLND